MLTAGKSVRGEGTAKVVHFRVSRRAERVDMIVATTLLVLLIFGWAIRLAPIETWPRGDYFYAVAMRHA